MDHKKQNPEAKLVAEAKSHAAKALARCQAAHARLDDAARGASISSAKTRQEALQEALNAAKEAAQAEAIHDYLELTGASQEAQREAALQALQAGCSATSAIVFAATASNMAKAR